MTQKRKRLTTIRTKKSARKKKRPPIPAEIKVLAGVDNFLRESGCEFRVNPAYDIPTNLQWLSDFIKRNERANVLMNQAMTQILESKPYQEKYLPEVTDGFFASTT